MDRATKSENDGSRLIVVRDIVEIVPDQPFYIMVRNTSKASVSPSKGMKVATLGESTLNIISVQDEITFYHVSAVPMYKHK